MSLLQVRTGKEIKVPTPVMFLAQERELAEDAFPGVVVELKWGASAQGAIAQMRERDYAAAFRGTSAEHRTILCGIAYDPKTKRHTCAIEQA